MLDVVLDTVLDMLDMLDILGHFVRRTRHLLDTLLDITPLDACSTLLDASSIAGHSAARRKPT